jgi:hypothetical protein
MLAPYSKDSDMHFAVPDHTSSVEATRPKKFTPKELSERWLRNEASLQDLKRKASDLGPAVQSVQRLEHFIYEYKHLEEDLDIERELVGTTQFLMSNFSLKATSHCVIMKIRCSYLHMVFVYFSNICWNYLHRSVSSRAIQYICF